MSVTRATVWSGTLLCTFAAWVALPGARIALSALLIAHAAVLAWGIANIHSRFFGPVLLRGNGQRICLTFDDGPDPAITGEILDLLARHSVKATFFVVAQRAGRNPDLVRRAVSEGHAVACHDLNHSVLSNFRLNGALTRDIRRARQILAGITGRTPLLYRPPVGLTNPHTHRALRALGMCCVGWTAAGREGGNRIEAGIRRISGFARPGAVVLLHDILPRPQYKALLLEQLDALCRSVKEQGLSAVTIGEMFGVAESQPHART
jgi:peptidoglycan/xylan/chitin deacetylase (PgdA/CDA1 family)